MQRYICNDNNISRYDYNLVSVHYRSTFIMPYIYEIHEYK